MKKPSAGNTAEDDAQFENGERCLICHERTTEPYGRPGACEDCGGDFVIMSEEDKEEEREYTVSVKFCGGKEKAFIKVKALSVVDALRRAEAIFRKNNPTGKVGFEAEEDFV